MLKRLLVPALVATLFALHAPVAPVAAAPAAPCANISRAACTLKGTYKYSADGANYVLAGNLTVKQAKTKLQIAGRLHFVQKGGVAPAPGTTVNLSVVFMSNRVGCVPGEGGNSRTLLVASAVPFITEDTLFDVDVVANEFSFKVTPQKSTRTVATIAADLRSAGAKSGEIVLLLDGGRACAALTTRR
jgi:hypothetical protein